MTQFTVNLTVRLWTLQFILLLSDMGDLSVVLRLFVTVHGGKNLK